MTLSSYKVISGDCIKSMGEMPDQSVNTVVTSPPYYGLRDYGINGQIGLENSHDEYIKKMVAVFKEVRRVLRDDGTLWLNIGDSYGKGKQLLGIPWRLAFALQDDGWILRQDIIWHKPNPMPESVRDRCTKAHEYIFLLSKSPKYFYDAEAIKTPVKQDWGTRNRANGKYHNDGTGLTPHSGLEKSYQTANKRSVWSVTAKPFKGAHFATFPPELIEPCILAGCPVGGVVLDPFGGSGTTAGVAVSHGRNAIICELNPEYINLVDDRVRHISKVYENRLGK
ncbi:site-specific DNA-methyltransferase [Serratia phage vB_SmaM-ChibiTotoro]|nr:site-specific DNA-methyltransferase [Serratia phage vB_SmaM-ChibiTotoro]